MKKLMTMVATASALVLGGVADAATCGDTVDCAFAYKVKILLRTTSANATNPTKSCEDKQCYRTTSRVRLIGYVYGSTNKEEVPNSCGCGSAEACACNAWGNAKIKLWNYDTHEAIAVDSVKLTVLDRILSSGSTDVAEIAINIDSLALSGFGKCGKRADGTVAIKNANGFCAGTLPCPVCTNCKECGDIVPASAWSICSLERFTLDVTPKKTTAYGKWNMIWDSDAVKALTSGKVLQPVNYDEAEEYDISLED